MPAVAFDYNGFIARYPEFASVSQPLLNAYFAEATIYLDNTDASPVCNLAIRSMLLNMIVAHIIAMNATVNGIAPSPLVGRVSNATEGSVSVGTEYAVPGTAAWYSQTKYGAAYWEATKRYRMALYLPGTSRPAHLLNRPF